MAPRLNDVVGAGSKGKNTLTILRLLRNSIHGAALQGVAFKENKGVQESLVGLPPADEVEVVAAMDALGGRAAWGFRQDYGAKVGVLRPRFVGQFP
jgi:hypothetical protein